MRQGEWKTLPSGEKIFNPNLSAPISLPLVYLVCVCVIAALWASDVTLQCTAATSVFDWCEIRNIPSLLFLGVTMQGPWWGRQRDRNILFLDFLGPILRPTLNHGVSTYFKKSGSKWPKVAHSVPQLALDYDT